MSLDSRYVQMTPIWELFSDKDSGEFLRNGYVKFWSDIERTVGKPVYKITGSPPNYTYIEYGTSEMDGSWRIDLNNQGAFDDIVYGFPYDASGNIELYFIKVYSSDDVEQFSREAQPNISGSGTSEEIDLNYVSNGQFLAHTDLPETDLYDAGEVRAAITNIAYGGWTFERPGGSTATDLVTFSRFGSATEDPISNPRYALTVECELPSPGDSYKDIRLMFPDVNKFASETNKFTFGISGTVNSGEGIDVDLILIKNFGTGGSTTTETALGTLSFTSAYSSQSVSFSFGTNDGKTIGALDDDYLQLALRLPTDSIFSASFTDALLAPGEITTPVFQDTTNSQFLYRSIAGWMPVPAYDGSDLYLPLRLSPTGLEFDDSEIGKICAATYAAPGKGELIANGTQLETNEKSSDGIPYSRLHSKLFSETTGLPMYGTGSQYLTAYFTGYPAIAASDSLRIQNNSTGISTDCSDGAVPTGFTFHNIVSGSQSTNTLGLFFGTNSLFIWNKQVGNPVNNGITLNDAPGFTANLLRDNPNVKTLSTLITPAATLLASKWFTFDDLITIYGIWFKVDGVGTLPVSPGVTFIEVDLLSTWNSQEVAYCICAAINGLKASNVITVAASSITTGSFFNMNTPSVAYYVWYEKDGAGTDPAPTGKAPIKVSILSADTAIQVAQKTQLAINSKYYALPDLRGMFLRGWNNGANIDTDYAKRWSFANGILTGDNLGTFELDEMIAIPEDAGGIGAPGVITGRANTSSAVSNIGGSETRPINAYVNYVIKY